MLFIISSILSLFLSSSLEEKIDKIINDKDKLELLIKNAIHSDVIHFNQSTNYKEVEKYLDGFEGVIKDERAKRGITDETIKSEKKGKK